MNEDFNS